jgi:hypothetical protein
MQEVLIRVCDATIPKKKWHNRSVPWWTPELARERRSTYQARRRYQAKDPATREQEKLRYREIRRNYTKVVTRARIQSWEIFVTKEGKKEPWGIAYRTVTGKLRREETMSTLRTSQADTSNWRSNAAAMLTVLIPDDQEGSDTPEQTEIRRNMTTLPNIEDITEFRIKELCGTVKRLTKGKCRYDRG